MMEERPTAAEAQAASAAFFAEESFFKLEIRWEM